MTPSIEESGRRRAIVKQGAVIGVGWSVIMAIALVGLVLMRDGTLHDRFDSNVAALVKERKGGAAHVKRLEADIDAGKKTVAAAVAAERRATRGIAPLVAKVRRQQLRRDSAKQRIATAESVLSYWIDVPDLVGLETYDISSVLSSELVYQETKRPLSEGAYEADSDLLFTVAEQDPPAGYRVPPGTTVYITTWDFPVIEYQDPFFDESQYAY